VSNAQLNMGARAKAVVFWLIMFGSAGALWLVSRKETWRADGWTFVVVICSVAFSNWFLGRYSGSRRKAASLLLSSVFVTFAVGVWMLWSYVLLSSNWQPRKNSVEFLLSLIGFGVCVSVSIWFFLRLRKSDPA